MVWPDVKGTTRRNHDNQGIKLTFKILGVDERLVQLEEGLVRAGVHPGHGLPIIDAETLGHVGLVIRNCNKQNGKF